ncbi:hypothetical protein PENTCL1PPCAC_27999 [Pristionchus entomophagus]|uniref:Uncharacterized protein n=1 Tax=Pristionchus entomophagus TaxID=358040 RepID=A0AAV5UFN4_9BILA|nr:hypothetical protein PENTCL1PPCAC_27999 [Pristionchus entomophagus]
MSWLTLASIPKLIFLLLPILIGAANFRAADLENKSATELEEYRRHLSEELDRVAQKVETSRDERGKRGKRTLLSPLSASIPNRESSYILDRINSLSGKEEDNAIVDEIIVSNKESEGKEPRIDEKLIALLNSLDDLTFDNVTVEGSGEDFSTPLPTLSPNTMLTASESTVIVETTTVDASASEESSDSVDSTALLTTEAAELPETSSSMTTSTTSPSEAPRRAPAHGVLTAVASPHSPSLSPTLANFSASMASMDGGSTTTTPTAPLTTTSEPEEREERREPLPPAAPRRVAFNPTVNHTAEECRHLTQHELVRELKQKGTYNPDLMAWDVFGILRFLDRTIAEQYEMQLRNRTRGVEAAERNIEALSRILGELDVSCDVRSDSVRERMQNMTMIEPRRSILSPRIRRRSKREAVLEELTRLMADLDENKMSSTTPRPSTTTSAPIYETVGNRQKLIGESHVVPFGCDRRGTEEDGYLRLCSACQSIRRLPDSFFPPFINEVTCDEDNACLYFYDYPHGRCKQKHMNFVVLRNIGTQECQVWRKFNLNVRVSCECFVDEMSFFAKYV